MIVKRLATKNFRNLKDIEIFPGEGVNVIYGLNAQGKTNLLEALWLFTGGHSFRGAKDSELPRMDGKNRASLSMDFFCEGRDQRAQIDIENGKKSSVINGVSRNSSSALVGKVRAVIFSPEHLLLVKEGAQRRRDFLDGAICQIRPAYVKLLAMYKRTLRERNALLKDIPHFAELGETLEAWNARLSQLGARLMAERRDYVGKLAPRAQEIYGGISRGGESMKISYQPCIKADENFTERDAEEIFLKALEDGREGDIRAGYTNEGPHRDDLGIRINSVSARMYGSQGQQRSAVLALKLAEAETLGSFSYEMPMILLDDVMSELDKNRQDYLLNNLKGRQVFITCCTPETVGLMETGVRFRVEGGEIYRERI